MNPRAAAEKRILVAATNVEDARLVAELLREDFDHIATTSDPEHAVADFEGFKPQILVLAFRTLEESERFYLGLYRLSGMINAIAHRTVVFCHRNDALRAYELCRKQHFDDYVVFWPVNYDPHRVHMAALLAARMGSSEGRAGPSPMEFAAQARRIAELEALLESSLARGDAHVSQVGDSLRQMEASVGEVLDGFSRHVLDGGHGAVVEVRDRAEFQREMTRLREAAVERPFASIGALLDPVRRWVDTFREEIAPQLESARALGELAGRVRPLVLVVDDDEFQHRLLQQMLSDAPIDLAFATSGTEAAARLRTERPDLILMDFQLPDATGVEVTRRLKASPLTSAIPIILITGTSTREVLVESHKAGAVDFMVKPFDRERLRAGINRHLYHAADLPPRPRIGGNNAVGHNSRHTPRNENNKP